MCLAQGPQRSDAGEARTRGPSVSSQALYHWATALPMKPSDHNLQCSDLIENWRLQQEFNRLTGHKYGWTVVYKTIHSAKS